MHSAYYRKRGIKDIFTDQLNGYYLNVNFEMNKDRLKDMLKHEVEEKLNTIIPDIAKYKHIAHFNRGEAMSKYTMEGYCRNIEKILIGENAK